MPLPVSERRIVEWRRRRPGTAPDAGRYEWQGQGAGQFSSPTIKVSLRGGITGYEGQPVGDGGPGRVPL